MTTAKRWIRWKPKYFRRAKEWGLNREPRAVKITVSLTSYPGRIKAVADTIDTMLTQTMKPDRVVLWLTESQFPNHENDLPCRLRKQMAYGLEIGWYRNIKSYTKLIPALEKYPDDIIVTVDDDVLYKPMLIEKLFASFLKYPDCVHSALTVSIAKRDDGDFMSYNDWKWNDVDHEPRTDLLLMGVSGVLYPPHALDSRVLDENTYMSIARTVDDLWFWAMAVLAGRKIRQIDGMGFSDVISNPYATQASALWNTNIGTEHGNDPQFRAILDKYPELRKKV